MQECSERVFLVDVGSTTQKKPSEIMMYVEVCKDVNPIYLYIYFEIYIKQCFLLFSPSQSPLKYINEKQEKKKNKFLYKII